MKKLFLVFMILIAGIFASGCSQNKEMNTVTDHNIPVDEITEFIYTDQDVSEYAKYQHYRIYTENGKHFLFNESRQRNGTAGPLTEEDTTYIGTIELDEEDYAEYLKLLERGEVSEKRPYLENSSGQWIEIHWKNDQDKYQNFEFATYEDLYAFQYYCYTMIVLDAQKQE